MPQTCAEVTAFVRARFAVAYTPHAMARLLGRLGFVYRKPKCVPAKADAAVQQAFLDACLKPLMEVAGPQAPLYFVDATHPSYTGRPAYGWLRKGKTVELKSNHGRTRININGVLSWPQRQFVHRQEELITSAAMIRLFEDLCLRHPGAEKITVVLDNARYNRSRELREWLSRSGRRIESVYLPPYAPNLNLIERFWHFMKRKVLLNKAYPTFALFEQAFQQFFKSLPDYAEQIASRITDRFHLIGHHGAGSPAA